MNIHGISMFEQVLFFSLWPSNRGISGFKAILGKKNHLLNIHSHFQLIMFIMYFLDNTSYRVLVVYSLVSRALAATAGVWFPVWAFFLNKIKTFYLQVYFDTYNDTNLYSSMYLFSIWFYVNDFLSSRVRSSTWHRVSNDLFVYTNAWKQQTTWPCRCGFNIYV